MSLHHTSNILDGATFERLKARLHKDIHMLNNSYCKSVNISQKWLELQKVLFKTNTIRDVFEIATLANKHSLIRKLFHPRLVYMCSYRVLRNFLKALII